MEARRSVDAIERVAHHTLTVIVREGGRSSKRRPLDSNRRHGVLDARLRGHDGGGHSTAAATKLRSMMRIYWRWPGPCIMNTANRSSFGSIQKNVPAIPLQKNSPSDPGNGARPSWVRTAKPRPKPWPAGIKGESTLTLGAR